MFFFLNIKYLDMRYKYVDMQENCCQLKFLYFYVVRNTLHFYRTISHVNKRKAHAVNIMLRLATTMSDTGVCKYFYIKKMKLP